MINKHLHAWKFTKCLESITIISGAAFPRHYLLGNKFLRGILLPLTFARAVSKRKWNALPHPPESADAMEGKKGRKSKIEKNIHMRFFTEIKTFLERKKGNTREGEGMLSKKHKL